MIGGAVTPEADPLGPMLAKFEIKVRAGVAVFSDASDLSSRTIQTFMQGVGQFKVKVLPGILLLR